MAQLVDLKVPNAPELLQALGALTIAHANMELTQIMCLKTLERLDVPYAVQTYRGKSASVVRKKVQAHVVAMSNPEDVADRDRVLGLIDKAWKCSCRRNTLAHRFCAITAEGAWISSGNLSKWEGLPTVDEIHTLFNDIERVAKAINDERFGDGFLLRLATRD